MKAVILAAGRGSRMKGWTEDVPKTMLLLKGKSLLQHQIVTLKAAGVEEIAVVTGYLKERVQADGITKRFENTRWDQSNMVRSLMMADEWLQKEPCLIGYGDIFYEPSAPEALMACDANIAMTYDVNFWELWSSRLDDPLSDLENFKIDQDNHVTFIGGRAQHRDEIQGQFMGLLMMRPEGWQQIKAYLDGLSSEAVDKLDMTSLLQALIKEGIHIRGVEYHDTWGEADTPEDLEVYNQSGAA